MGGGKITQSNKSTLAKKTQSTPRTLTHTHTHTHQKREKKEHPLNAQKKRTESERETNEEKQDSPQALIKKKMKNQK